MTDTHRKPDAYFNTIFHHGAADYASICCTSANSNKICAAGNVIPDIPLPNNIIRSDHGYAYNNSQIQDPKLENEARTKGFVKARGVAGDSPFRRGGYVITYGTDGALYFYDLTRTVSGAAAPCWRAVCPASVYLTDSEAASLGLSLANPVLPPDAFGEPRSSTRLSLGPLNARQFGSLLWVR